jgi:hypothetical protein
MTRARVGGRGGDGEGGGGSHDIKRAYQRGEERSGEERR